VGESVSPALAALGIPTPGPADDVPSRHRASAAVQWLHLLTDQGLGTVDRVHPDDVGEPAGSRWLPQLVRAHRRESLGDWRVHLRLGELAFLAGRSQEARDRWEWSNSLRPTPWADRNLALLDLATGDRNSAAVRYLRAHRRHPEDPELGVEAVGCLLAAGRATDCTVVLDRMALRAQDASARYWALKAEVAIALGEPTAARRALESATSCADAVVQGPWLTALRATT
jgi:predicted Zn-dependent protease